MAVTVGGVCDSEEEQACVSPDATQNVGVRWGRRIGAGLRQSGASSLA
jgi:hypothetical protein